MKKRYKNRQRQQKLNFKLKLDQNEEFNGDMIDRMKERVEMTYTEEDSDAYDREFDYIMNYASADNRKIRSPPKSHRKTSKKSKISKT